MYRFEPVLITGLLLAAAGCGDRSAPLAAGGSASGTSGATGPLAAALVPGVSLDEPVRRPAAGAPPEIGPGRAVEIAEAWAAHYAPLLSAHWEARRSGPIAWGALRVCGRGFYAATPFEPGSETVPLPVRRGFGPWWVLAVCGPGGEPQLAVAVSAWATDLELKRNRHPDDDRPPSPMRPAVLLSGPERSGVHLVPLAIPAALPFTDGLPISPEEAVERVAELAGRPVTEAPELVVRPGLVPQLAVWRVSVDEAVAVRDLGTGALLEASEFFVGFEAGSAADAEPAVMVADPEQPGSRAFRYTPTEALRSGASPDAAGLVTDQVQRRADYPLALRAVGPHEEAGTALPGGA